jgi:two-component system KDP operon response regulator KdpE
LDKPLILVVDDDRAILRFVKTSLERNGFAVSLAADGGEAIQKIEAEPPSLIILDMKMPRLDGVEVIRRLREWSHIPIIMLSGYASDADQVQCLNMGADDFMAKPFKVDEMVARIRAIMRRSSLNPVIPERPAFKTDRLEISFNQRRVTVDGREVKLTPTEYALLCELALNSNKVLTHAMLLKRIWGPEYGEEREYLRTFIGRLRKILGEEDAPHNILTVSGVGYQFKIP